jgi:hypothetical protein
MIDCDFDVDAQPIADRCEANEGIFLQNSIQIALGIRTKVRHTDVFAKLMS